MNHKTIKVKVGDQEGDIDEKIAPLIKLIWQSGIYTLNCCENNVPEDWVWIEFMSVDDAELFLNLVARYSDDMDNSMYHRIRNVWDAQESMQWKYQVHLDDLGVDFSIDDNDDSYKETFSGEHTFNFTMSVRFPQSDLPEVFKNLKESFQNLN